MTNEARLLGEIAALTKTLNQLDDALGHRIQAREELLKQHNPGARISLGSCEGGEVRWGKHSGHWRLLWVSADGTVPLSRAPRHVRAAFSHVIDDVDAFLGAVATALAAEIKLREKT